MKILRPLIWFVLSAPVLGLACSSDSDDIGVGANAVGGSQTDPANSKGAGAGVATASASSTSSNGFEVTFLGSQANADGTSTWRYRVSELPCAQDLSNWVLEVFDCPVVSATPEPNEFVHPDPNAGLTGVKWETGGGFASGEFAVTVSGAARAATIRFGVKGPDVELGETTGPRCGDAAAPPVGGRSAKPRGGKDRCRDAGPPPPSDATPPTVDATPPPPPSDGGCMSGIRCLEGEQCPLHYFCAGDCCITE
jgi:hypothetical protein